MNETDRGQFSKAMRRLFATYEMPFDDDAVSVWWSALKRYEIHAVLRAFGQHIAGSTARPRPAHIIALLPASPVDWPSPEKAVSLMVFTESSTAVMCEEMLQAAIAVQEQFESGDRIGARINAKRIYEEAVQQAKAEGKRPAWRCVDGSGLRQEEREHARLQAWQSAHASGVVDDNTVVRALAKIGESAMFESTRQSLASMARTLPALQAPDEPNLDNVVKIKQMFLAVGK